MTTMDEAIRPAPAGRVLGAIAVSLLVHALLLTASAGRGDGGGPAQQEGRPLPPLFASLQPESSPAATLAAQQPAPPAETDPATAATSFERAGAGDGSPIGLAPPSRYYPARELDIRPQIRNQVEPAYPRSAFEQGQAATVQLRILIDSQGRIDQVRALDREAGDPFAAAAIAAFRDARYTPGYKNGVPVPSEIVIEVRFESVTVADSFRGSRY
jgi:protein TonB